MTRKNLMGVGERRYEADFKRFPHVRLESEEIYEQCNYSYTMARAQHNAVKHDLSCKGEGEASSMKSWGSSGKAPLITKLGFKPRLLFHDKDASVPTE